jgi:dihydrodipicolinate synthase/N-acetylneuraminate lyase
MELNQLRARLCEGLVIPAHPLALTAERRLDEKRQAALTRYYAAAGAGGIAVGVHSTQFAIRTAGLFEPVLELAAVEADAAERRGRGPLVRIAGAIGPTAQAVAEAETARRIGYDAVLLSLAALRDAGVPDLVTHCRRVADVLPLIGFYLQPAVGGRDLPPTFWRGFLEIEAVVAIKVAPFDRYRTLDVVRAVAESGRASDVALYTGNDDAIVADLLSDFAAGANTEPVRFVGGLLGQWGVWTRRAVELLDAVKDCRAREGRGALELLALGQQLTDANAAIFDAAHDFRGCIPGILEVLRRQGLVAGRWCLDPAEELSPGQAEEIDRVIAGTPTSPTTRLCARIGTDGWPEVALHRVHGSGDGRGARGRPCAIPAPARCCAAPRRASSASAPRRIASAGLRPRHELVRVGPVPVPPRLQHGRARGEGGARRRRLRRRASGWPPPPPTRTTSP